MFCESLFDYLFSRSKIQKNYMVGFFCVFLYFGVGCWQIEFYSNQKDVKVFLLDYISFFLLYISYCLYKVRFLNYFVIFKVSNM